MTASTDYIFDGSRDSSRLLSQDSLFTPYLQTHASRWLGFRVQRILDVGCGNGALGRALLALYPAAELVGVDRDPAAVAVARESIRLGVKHVAYQIGDIEQAVPPGPFDVVLANVVLSHLHQPAATLAHIFSQLRPGGHLWIKEMILQPRPIARFSPAIQALADLLAKGMRGLGASPDLPHQLPDRLAAAGFVDIQQEAEEYALGGPTPQGQAALSICLAAFMNARPVLTRTSGLPSETLDQLYVAAREAASSGLVQGVYPLINYVAARPASEP